MRRSTTGRARSDSTMRTASSKARSLSGSSLPRNGAAGYVLKQIKGSDLVDAVRRVAAGESLLDPAVTRQVLERLRAEPAPAEDEALGALSPQERRILDLIAEGYTNRQIADEIFLA